MSGHMKAGILVAISFILAVAFGWASFLRELDSVRRTQDPGVEECKKLIGEARAFIESAKKTREADPCAAEAAQARAVETMDSAQKVCRRFLDKDPMVTSDAALARMEQFRADLTRECRDTRPAQAP
jgi:hypothetical protein